MSHPYLQDARFYAFLLRIDVDMAERVRERGCPAPDCGGVLHSARFPRKLRVRGISWRELGDDYAKRLSFCCAVDGCRARTTPPSVRFLGRRWYLGVLVLLAGVLSQGLTHGRAKGICAQLHVPWRTLERWREWWQETLPQTPFWRAAGRCLVPPVAAEALPSSLFERFRGSEEERVVATLRWLAAITTTSPGCAG